MVVSAVCHSVVQIPDGKSHVGGEPFQQMKERKKKQKKKGEMVGDTGTGCFYIMRFGCCAPGSAGCRSQVWMKSLVGCLTSLCFPLTPLSSSHSFTFYRDATDNSRRVMCCSVTGSSFCFEYAEKTGKSLCLLWASASLREHLPFWCSCEDLDEVISRICLCERNFWKYEKFIWVEKAFFLQKWYINVKTRNCSQ